MRSSSQRPAETVTGYLVAAIRHHLMTGAVFHEVAEAAFCVYLIHLRAPDRLAPDYFMLYPALLAIVVAGTVAYRRTMMCRQDRLGFAVGDVENRHGFLMGEMLACLAISMTLVIMTTVVGLIMVPLATPGVAHALGGLALIALMSATAISVTYLFSWLAMGSDLPSVLAIVVLVFGVSRSSLAQMIMESVGFPPFVLVLNIATPPLEELIKCAMSGLFANYWLLMLQNSLFVILTTYWASWLFVRRTIPRSNPSARPARGKVRQHA